MNSDRIKGTIDEAAGLAKRKAGEWAGSTKLEVEGVLQQIEGKVENAWGKAKEAVHDANEVAAIKHKTRTEVDIECATREDSISNK